MSIQSLFMLLFLGVLAIISGLFFSKSNEQKFYIEPKEYFNKEGLIEDKKKVDFDDSITSEKLVNEMGFGWNLGNTLDAHNKEQEGIESETSWENPLTTEEMIKEVVKKGFKTIRLPTTWHNHFIDNNYTIDPKWMERVKTVVDWAINNGLYVILNTHHDNAQYSKDPITYGAGYYPSYKDIEESEKFIYNVWRQIATAFNNGYDHHLIFEGLNEPRLIGNTYEWNYNQTDKDCTDGVEVLNEYMRLIVKAIRESGGNNEKRFVMITPLAAGYSFAANSPVIFPDDSKYNKKNNKLLLSVHMYAPYDFALNGDMQFTKFTDAYKEELYENLVTLYKKYISLGHNIVIGEMGSTNKNNKEERDAWGEYYIKHARKFNMACILWDNGQFDNSESASEIFGSFHRDQLTWENSDLIDHYITYATEPFEKFDEAQLFSIELTDTFSKEGLVVDDGKIEFNNEITAAELVNSVGMGWNLGNTLDANEEVTEGFNQGLSSEESWGNPKTTEAMIEFVAKSGFKTLRVPTTWHNHFIDEKYTIDPEWMKRVKTIVDWGIKYGLNVILNVHHDIYTNTEEPLTYGKGYFPLKKDIKESEKFIYNVWKQIVEAFNNGYDHHLIFEGLNEPRLAGTEYEWSFNSSAPVCIEGREVLNEYMRLIVKIIRESGGNNEKRFIMITPLAAGFQPALESGLVFPDDSKYNPNSNKLILSVHMYAPYDLALNADKSFTKFEESYKVDLKDNFEALYKKFVSNNQYVIIGEMGIVNKNNTEDRLAWADYYVTTARNYHLSTVLWDNGKWDVTDTGEIIGELHRDELKWHNDELIQTYIKASQTEFAKDLKVK